MRWPLAALVLVAVLAGGCGGGGGESTPPPAPEPAPAPEPPPDPPSEPPPPEPRPPEPAPPAPPQPPPAPDFPPLAFSWQAAGAFVWHETDVSPEALGAQLRHAGFGWVAVYLHDGLTEDPVEDDWVARFRRASGLPVGGWGALRAQPVEEAELASLLVARYGLDFYIANAEAEYVYSGPDGPSAERHGRSRHFVTAFRRLRPELPAGLSSYCRPDRHDLDWPTWRDAGFAFLPQAYVNDFGAYVTPAMCAASSRGAFASGRVHPTVGMYPGVTSSLPAERYARLLERARTVGFSVYLAETRMTDDEWRVLGEAIAARGIARLPVS